MRRAGATRAPRAVGVFFALTFVVFTCVFPYMAPLNNPDENVRVYMTMAIVHDHTFQIDKTVERMGWVNDMALAPDKAGVSHYYAIKAPAASYAAVPFYWVFSKLAPHFGHPAPTLTSPVAERMWWMRASTFVMRFFVVQLPCFAFLVWFERWLRQLTGDVALRLTAVAAAGLGTNYLAYALMFASHAPFAIAAFGSFGVTYGERLRSRGVARRRRLSRAFLAGFWAGMATLLEYQALPVSVGLAIYAFFTFYRPTRLAMLTLGGLLNAGALMYYQWRCYGNPLTPGHKFAESPVFQAWHKSGFYGLSKPSWAVFTNLSVSPDYGFFGTSPYMWLGLLAIPFALVFTFGTRFERRERRIATLVWMLMMLALWVAISSAVNWRGGWVVGPRFFGAAPPFFAFGAVCALEKIAGASRARRAVVRAIAAGLCIASVVQSGFTSLVFNTYPESVTRPLAQVALPLARAGFVPHTAAELFGVRTYIVWDVIAAGAALGVLLVAFHWQKDRWWTMTIRVLLGAVFAAAALIPAFSKPLPIELGDNGVSAVRNFAREWEPPGRDRISRLRDEAERYGPRAPCLWFKIADLERSISWSVEAERDEKRAGTVPRTACR
jgi:hypothetical protein